MADVTKLHAFIRRAYKERMKIGRFADQDPEEVKRREEEKIAKERREQELAEAIKVNDRYCYIAFQRGAVFSLY